MTQLVDVSEPGAFETALFNPFLQEVRADPWPLCHRLRERDPVYESPFGFYVLTGYADSLKVLRDPRFSVDPRNIEQLPGGSIPDVLGPGQRGLDHMMLFVDPPDHTRLRALVNKAFNPRVVERMRPRIQQIVDDALDRAEREGGMDMIANFAYLLPVTVICDLLGIPGDDRGRFRAWVLEITPILDPLVPLTNVDRIAEAGAALVDYFDGLIARRRADPGDDLVSELVRAEEEGERLSAEELRATCVLLLIAGHETTMNLIGNGTLALLRARDQLERLAAEPSLIRSAVEELVRHDGPGLLTARTALEDVEVRGHLIRKGKVALVLIAAANRDPEQFPDPDRLDLGRDPNRHLAFSAGPHFCIGATLARAESQIAFGRLVDRFPSIELAEEPRWRHTVTFRGLESLRVTI
jgi:pimeloyl-[acyl-carrier protein] synthase